ESPPQAAANRATATTAARRRSMAMVLAHRVGEIDDLRFNFDLPRLLELECHRHRLPHAEPFDAYEHDVEPSRLQDPVFAGRHGEGLNLAHPHGAIVAVDRLVYFGPGGGIRVPPHHAVLLTARDGEVHGGVVAHRGADPRLGDRELRNGHFGAHR